MADFPPAYNVTLNLLERHLRSHIKAIDYTGKTLSIALKLTMSFLELATYDRPEIRIRACIERKRIGHLYPEDFSTIVCNYLHREGYFGDSE